jgi:hypothetical protein
MPSAEAVASMMKYNEELKKAGILLALDGLHPPAAGRGSVSRAASRRSSTVHSPRSRKYWAATG